MYGWRGWQGEGDNEWETVLRAPTMDDYAAQASIGPRTMEHEPPAVIREPVRTDDAAYFRSLLKEPGYGLPQNMWQAKTHELTDQDILDYGGATGGVVKFGKMANAPKKAASGEYLWDVMNPNPYRKLVDYLHNRPEKYFIPNLPETTRDPLVVRGEKHLPPIRGKLLGEDYIGYYGNPKLMADSGFFDDTMANNAIDMVAYKKGFPSTIDHELFHRMYNVVQDDNYTRFDKNRLGLQKDIVDSAWSKPSLIKESVHQIPDNIGVSTNAPSGLAEALLDMYPEDHLSEEIAARAFAKQWPRDVEAGRYKFDFEAKEAANYGRAINEDIENQRQIRDIFSAIRREIPDWAYWQD